MQCSVPLKNGSKCPQPKCANSNHCSYHRNKAFKSYTKYKAPHKAAKKYNHQQVLLSKDQNVLMKYYNILYKAYVGRSVHSSKFFVEEERDPGHKRQIEILKDKLAQTEEVLSTLFHPKSGSEDSGKEEETVSEEDSSEEEPACESLQSDLSHKSSIAVDYNQSIAIEDNGYKERQLLNENILTNLINKSEFGLFLVNPSKQSSIEKTAMTSLLDMTLLFSAVVLKSDKLGYFDPEKVSKLKQCDYYNDPDNMIQSPNRFLTNEELKIVYKRILLNWNDVKGICNCIYTMCCGLVGHTEITCMPFKVCRIAGRSSMYISMYFRPTTQDAKILNALCTIIARSETHAIAVKNAYYFTAIVPSSFLLCSFVKKTKLICFESRMSNGDWIVYYRNMDRTL